MGPPTTQAARRRRVQRRRCCSFPASGFQWITRRFRVGDDSVSSGMGIFLGLEGADKKGGDPGRSGFPARDQTDVANMQAPRPWNNLRARVLGNSAVRIKPCFPRATAPGRVRCHRKAHALRGLHCHGVLANQEVPIRILDFAPQGRARPDRRLRCAGCDGDRAGSGRAGAGAGFCCW